MRIDRPASGIHRTAKSRQGFTLVEMMVVLAIAAIASGIVIAGFSEMNSGHRRVSCQTNMNQIYQALRLYVADQADFPYYDQNNVIGNGPSIGLWGLYTFQEPGTSLIAPVGSKPTERYLRSTKVLHCPNDFDNRTLFDPSNPARYNPAYLSYQTLDGATSTYQSARSTSSSDPNWKRQLLHYDGSPLALIFRSPADDTVITWCRWHRGSVSNGGQREYDNVLFYDGSVELLPSQADTSTGQSCASLSPPTCDPNLGACCFDTWRRKPKVHAGSP